MPGLLAIALLGAAFACPGLAAQEQAAQGQAAGSKPMPADFPGPSFLSSSFIPAAEALEGPLMAMLAAKDKKAGEAALAALRVQRRKAEDLEKALLGDWAAWADSVRDASARAQGSVDLFSGYDRAAHAAKLSGLRSAEGAALAEAQRIVAKAAGAKGFSASALRLLGDFDRALELPPGLRAGSAALAALKADALKNSLAAALCARPRLYIDALAVAFPRDGAAGGMGLRVAAEAFRLALFAAPASPSAEGAPAGASPGIAGPETPQGLSAAALKAELEAAAGLAAEAGEGARLLGLYYTGADFFGFLSIALLARPSAERAFLTGIGISPPQAYGVLGSAFSYKPWPKPEPGEEQARSALALYADWLSAQLRRDSLEASRFARLSAAPGLKHTLFERAAAPHKAALELSFERFWLEARDALAHDLRADTLLWLRGMGQKPAPDSLSLEARITRWPALPLTAGIELVAKSEGKSYALPYAAIAASLEASLGSVFGPELPSYVYLEARGSVGEAFRGPAGQSAQVAQAMGEELSSRYALGAARSVEAWMEGYLRQSTAIRGLAGFYARSAEAASLAAEPWYAALTRLANDGSLP